MRIDISVYDISTPIPFARAYEVKYISGIVAPISAKIIAAAVRLNDGSAQSRRLIVLRFVLVLTRLSRERCKIEPRLQKKSAMNPIVRTAHPNPIFTVSALKIWGKIIPPIPPDVTAIPVAMPRFL